VLVPCASDPPLKPAAPLPQSRLPDGLVAQGPRKVLEPQDDLVHTFQGPQYPTSPPPFQPRGICAPQGLPQSFQAHQPQVQAKQ